MVLKTKSKKSKVAEGVEEITTIPGAIDLKEEVEEAIWGEKKDTEVVDLPKPDQVAPRDQADQQYYEQHQGLPTTTERSEQEVLEDEAQQLAERAQAKKTIEAEAIELGTIAGAATLQAVQSQKTEELIEVEGIISDGLEEYFINMTPQQQQIFKQTGEETAGKIVTLLYGAKVQVSKILDLIKQWLKLIPGVNKFFLEQESKIKTDALLKMKKDKEEGAIM